MGEEEAWKITFDWRHPADQEARQRIIYYIGNRKVSDLHFESLPSEIQSVIEKNGGVDIFLEKGPDYYSRELGKSARTFVPENGQVQESAETKIANVNRLYIL